MLPQAELCVMQEDMFGEELGMCCGGFGDELGDDFVTADSNPMSETPGNSHNTTNRRRVGNGDE